MAFLVISYWYKETEISEFAEVEKVEKVVLGSREFAEGIAEAKNAELKNSRNYCYTDIQEVEVVSEEKSE